MANPVSSVKDPTEDVAAHVNAVIMAFPAGLTLKMFLEEYETLVGRPLPFRDLGFDGPRDLLLSLPRSIKVIELKNRDILLKAVPNEKNSHVFELVEGQQKKKNRSVKHVKRIVQHALSLRTKNRFGAMSTNGETRTNAATAKSPAKSATARNGDRPDGSTVKLSIRETVHKPVEPREETVAIASYRQSPTCSSKEKKKNVTGFEDDVSESPVPWAVRGSPASIPYEDFEADLQSQGFVFVQIAEIFHPEDFWWYLLHRQADIEKLSDDMKEFYEDPENEASFRLEHCQLYVGQYVAAQYSVDDLWYRAKVLSFGFDSVTNVLFVDYGTLDGVRIQNIRRLDVHFTQLPLQGRRGRLFNVVPNTPCQKKWSREASEYFRNLVYNKGLVAYFVNHDPHSREKEDNHVYDLILVDTTESDVFLADQLVDERYATLRVQPSEDEPTSPDQNGVADPIPDSPVASQESSGQLKSATESDVDEISSYCPNISTSTTNRDTVRSTGIPRGFVRTSGLVDRSGVHPAPMRSSSAPGCVVPLPVTTLPLELGYGMSQFTPLMTGVPFSPLGVTAPSPVVPNMLMGAPLLYRGMAPMLHWVPPARYPPSKEQQMAVLHQRVTPVPTTPFPDLLVNLSGAAPSSSPGIPSPAPQTVPPSFPLGPKQSLATKPSSHVGNTPTGLVKLIRLGNGRQLHLAKTRGAFHLAAVEVFELCPRFAHQDDMELTLRLRQVALPVRCSRRDEPDLFAQLMQCNVSWLRLKPNIWIDSFNAYRLDYAVAILRIFGAKNSSVISILQGELESFGGN